jgi:hypothetical protein
MKRMENTLMMNLKMISVKKLNITTYAKYLIAMNKDFNFGFL